MNLKNNIYNQKGEKTKDLNLPEGIFGADWNPNLVHQIIVSMQTNRRRAIAHTKDRSDVRGGGKKPWRQKGTGRARHGSIRSPIWVGGGVTFGPRNERKFEKKINKKMLAKALFSTLSKKLEDKEILFVDNLFFEKPSTKEAKSFLENLEKGSKKEGLSGKKSVIFFVKERTEGINKSFSNFDNIKVEEIRNLNPLCLLENKMVIIADAEDSVEFLKSKLEKFKNTEVEDEKENKSRQTEQSRQTGLKKEKADSAKSSKTSAKKETFAK